jgi:hypothetical protein
MASFFKGVAKGAQQLAKQAGETVANAVELATLDNIVDDLVESCDADLMTLAKSFEKDGVTAEAAEALESDLWIRYFQSYDKRAQKAVGRNLPTLPVDWSEGKDNLQVRKRILGRNLDKRKGFICSTVQAWRSGKVAMHAAALADARIKLVLFQDCKRREFPIEKTRMEADIAEFRQMLLVYAGSIFSPGMEELRAFCSALGQQNAEGPQEVSWLSFVEGEVPPALDGLIIENNAAIEATKADVLQKSLARLREVMLEQMAICVDAYLASSVTEAALHDSTQFLTSNDRLLLINAIMNKSKKYESAIGNINPTDVA